MFLLYISNLTITWQTYIIWSAIGLVLLYLYFISALTISLLAVNSLSVSASTKTEEILSLMPGVTAEELEQSINDAASSQNISKEEVEDKILNEIKLQKALDRKEKLASSSRW